VPSFSIRMGQREHRDFETQHSVFGSFFFPTQGRLQDGGKPYLCEVGHRPAPGG
jgi:hypothetical protein